MASVSHLLPVQVTVEDALTRQQHVLAASLDGTLLVQLVTQPATILSQQKHSEELFIVRLPVQENMSGGIKAALLLALIRPPMDLMRSLERLFIASLNALIHVVQINIFIGIHLAWILVPVLLLKQLTKVGNFVNILVEARSISIGTGLV